jgi:hypothetical protein
MLELISIVASIALIILTPIQTSQIVAGKFSPKLKTSPAAYVAAFRKQIGMLVWLGAVFAVLNLLLIFISTEPGEWLFKLIGAVLWAAVAGVSFFSNQRLAKLPAPNEGGGAPA